MEMVSTLWTENLCHVGCIVQAGSTHEAGGLWLSERNLGPGFFFFFPFGTWLGMSVRDLVHERRRRGTTIAIDNSDDNEDDNSERQ